MAISELPASTIFQFIVDDFESAWGALVTRRGRNAGGGNFMFALLSMILLELACRVCRADTSNKKLADLTNVVKRIEPRYFTQLPGPCARTSEFTLPGANPGCDLLGMMFDLIRNGKAHQYQSAIVRLSDGDIDIDLAGAASGRSLDKPGRRRPTRHLRYKVSPSGDLYLYVRTDQLFLDIKRSIQESGVISPSDVVMDITRPRAKSLAKKPGPSPSYAFAVAEIERSLQNGGHRRL
jgi:hypothetical protein